MTRIDEYMMQLARKRPVFHSEADFQHELAWLIHEKQRNSSIRLEYPRTIDGKPAYVDILIRQANCAIELKYKTAKQRVEIEGEVFALKGQNAQDTGCYDFLKDVERLEWLVDNRIIEHGYAVFLTNDQKYWLEPQSVNTHRYNFRICSGRSLHNGNLGWREGTAPGSMRGREDHILIRGPYELQWREYSKVKGKPFKYLCVEVCQA